MSGQRLVVSAMHRETSNVVSVRLEARDGRWLARWSPGAHVDVDLPNWLRRQYSLCGDPADRTYYRIAVRKETLSRGGSEYIHDFLRTGQRIAVSRPRNNFPLHGADTYLFIAGGIGITPILPMLHEAAATGRRWRLVYIGRSMSTMPFTGELSTYGDQVEIVPTDQLGVPDLGQIVSHAGTEALVYGCGPESLLTALTAAVGQDGSSRLHTERFRAPKRRYRPDSAFTVICRKSGGRVRVRTKVSMLDALARAGLPIAAGCREGVCGSCGVRVVDGVPDHRDELPEHRADLVYPCVSRSRSAELTLDL